MDATTLLLLLGGLVVLVLGAEVLVRGATRLAAAFRVSPVVIGLTVVAYGTSAPELAVSAISAVDGQPDIALGNVVGSNIFNVLFILGISALITPLVVAAQLVRLDVPIMIGAALLTWLFAADGHVSRVEGGVLVAALLVYTALCIRQGRKEEAPVTAEFAQEFATPAPAAARRAWPVHVVLVLAGLGLLVLGSRWLVTAAVTLARAFGVSELVIGLTIVAAGTSLPEVATSIVASIRGERDIAVGNVVGSNIFNALGVLGAASVIGSEGVAVAGSALRFDLPIMVAVCGACLPIFFTGHRIDRWEGALFLFYWAAYTSYLILASLQHHALGLYGTVMLTIVVPLTVATLAIAVWRQRHRDAAPPLP